MSGSVVLLGMSNTKGAELAFIQEQLKALGCGCFFIDMALQPSGDSVDKSRLMHQKADEVQRRASQRLANHPHDASLAIGGAVGSWMAVTVFRSLPFGVGKVLVSTLPYDPGPDLADIDIVLIPSITDIQSLNPTLRAVLRRAAGIAASLRRTEPDPPAERQVVAITGLGVTQGAAADNGVPQVVCPGGPRLPHPWAKRVVIRRRPESPPYRHSPKFTHVRATPEELSCSARALAARIRGAGGPCAVMIPRGGFSQSDRPGSPMWRPDAMTEFVSTLSAELPASIEMVELPDHINSPRFGTAVVEKLLSFLNGR